MNDKELWDAILEANKQWMDAYSRGDAVSVGAFYTDDARSLPPNSDTIHEKQAIVEYWKAAMEMGIKGLKIETKEVESQNDTAYEIGETTLTGERGKIIDKLKYMVIWKYQNGQWKIHREIWNSSMKA
jgi:ketosteroid isomerase-like protein